MRPKKDSNIQIGDRIRRAREYKRLTQEQFAELIDRTPQFISDLERGVSGASIETLRIICEKLCVSSDSIIFPDRGEDEIDRLIKKFSRMTPQQLHIMEEMTDAFLLACISLQDQK